MEWAVCRYDAVNACLVPLGTVSGLAVVTVEGLGSVRPGHSLHPIQERLSKGAQSPAFGSNIATSSVQGTPASAASAHRA